MSLSSSVRWTTADSCEDLPILGDVWIEFATSPGRSKDLLISPYSSPYKTQGAGPLARAIADRIDRLREASSKRRKKPVSGQRKAAENTGAEIAEQPNADAPEEAHVAYLQGVVAARLFFPEVLRVIIPMTHWWQTSKDRISAYDLKTVPEKLKMILRWIKAQKPELESDQRKAEREVAPFTPLDRYLLLAGLILWASQEAKKRNLPAGIGALVEELHDPELIGEALNDLYEAIREDEQQRINKRVDQKSGDRRATSEVERPEPVVYQISMNRVATPALERSVPAVKGDAARTLFTVKCSEIGWAVID